MKPYTVIFPTGLAGSFLIYFISSHREFLCPGPLELDGSHPMYGDIKHLGLSGPTNALYPNNWITDEKFKNRVEDLTSQYAKQKIICKIRPHGYWIAKEYMENLALFNVIVLYSDKIQELYTKLNRPDIYEDRKTQIDDFDFSLFEALRAKTDLILVCPYKILIEKSDNEYNLLCKWLNVEPLNNWKDLVEDYLDLVV